MICSICGGNNISIFLQIKRYEKEWDIYKCDNCLTQFINPIPSDEELQIMYDEFYKEDAEQVKRLFNPNYGVLSFPRQWGIIKVLTKKKYGRIMDFGCGGGHFLDRVSGNWDKYGVELSERARNIATLKKIKTFATLEDGKFPNEYFDVVVMFATIEHLPNPKDVVSQLSKLLKIGGLFVIATGDVESLKAKRQGKNWHLYAPPGHIYYFTANSLDYLMKSFGYKKIKHLYTDGGATQISLMPLNMMMRVGLEIYHRIPVLNTIPLFDAYYGYYRRVK